jgi:hypothetical protein
VFAALHDDRAPVTHAFGLGIAAGAGGAAFAIGVKEHSAVHVSARAMELPFPGAGDGPWQLSGVRHDQHPIAIGAVRLASREVVMCGHRMIASIGASRRPSG